MRRLNVIIILLCISNILFSQYNTKGTEFWLTFIENIKEDSGGTILYLSSDTDNRGVVRIPGTGWEQSFTIMGGTTLSLIIPESEMAAVVMENTVLDKGVYVKSDKPLSLFASNQKVFSSDATIVLPMNILSDKYYVASYDAVVSDFTKSSYSMFAIVGIEDNSQVEIIPSSDILGGVNAFQRFFVTLNKGQVYLLKSEGDLTGSSVKILGDNECRRIAVFGGVSCGKVPNSLCCCDHLFSQVIPVALWGKNYIVVQPLDKYGGDNFRIMAKEDNTIVNIINVQNVSLNAGEFYEINLRDAIVIQADKPISVTQYCRGTGNSSQNGDPYMFMLFPLEQATNEASFSTFPTENINKFYLNIVAKTSETNQILLDNLQVQGWMPVHGDRQYSYARVRIGEGNHSLRSKYNFNATVYGLGRYEAYAFPAGATFPIIKVDFNMRFNDTVINIDESKEISLCSGTFVEFDTESENIYDINWIFGEKATHAKGKSVSRTFNDRGIFNISMSFIREETRCSDKISAKLNVGNSLVNYNFVKDTAICNENYFEINGNPQFQYLWYDGSRDNRRSFDSSGNYIVTLTDDYGCKKDYKWSLLFYVLEVKASTILKCNGKGSILTHFEELYPPYSYEWDDYFSSNTKDLYDVNPGTYSVSVTDSRGCSVSVSEELTIPYELYVNENQCISIANAFTPNGDGNNDTWVITGIDRFPGSVIKVYNRWGQEIFNSSESGNLEWDGRYQNKMIPTGSYMYVIELNYNDEKYSGVVSVVY